MVAECSIYTVMDRTNKEYNENALKYDPASDLSKDLLKVVEKQAELKLGMSKVEL